MDFQTRLRMNNIFPTEGFNPLQPSATPQGINLDEISAIIGRLSPAIQANKDADLGRQKDLLRFKTALDTPGGMNAPIGSQSGLPMGGGALNNIAKQTTNPMNQGQPNVVYDRRPELQDLQMRLKRDELSQKRNLAEQGLDIKRGDSDIRQQRADVYQFKAEHPELKFDIGANGNFITKDPRTGAIVDTGHSSAKMSDAEKLKITGQQKVEQIEKRNEGNTNIQNLKGSQGLANIAARVAGQKSVQADKPVKEELPTQTKVKHTNNANELMNTRPELGKFIKTDQQGNVTVEPPGQSGGFFGLGGGPTGPTAAQFKEINDFIFGNGSSTVKKPTEQKKEPEVKKPASKYKVNISG